METFCFYKSSIAVSFKCRKSYNRILVKSAIIYHCYRIKKTFTSLKLKQFCWQWLPFNLHFQLKFSVQFCYYFKIKSVISHCNYSYMTIRQNLKSFQWQTVYLFPVGWTWSLPREFTFLLMLYPEMTWQFSLEVSQTLFKLEFMVASNWQYVCREREKSLLTSDIKCSYR